jgi:hypothetical protein
MNKRHSIISVQACVVLALMSVLVLGAGSVPVTGIHHGVLQDDLNANGRSITNAAVIDATQYQLNHTNITLGGSGGGAGTNGNNGTNGLQGPQGVAGNNGTNGLQGPQGVAGNNGTNGLQGPQGVAGPTNIATASTVGAVAVPAASGVGVDGSGNLTAPDAYTTLSNVSSTGTVPISITGKMTTAELTMLAGSAPYNCNVTLSHTNAYNGWWVALKVNWPTSTNPTFTSYDNTTGGAVLQGPLAGTINGGTITYNYKYDGSTWHYMTTNEVAQRLLGANVYNALTNATGTPSGIDTQTQSDARYSPITGSAAYVPRSIGISRFTSNLVGDSTATSNGTDTGANSRLQVLSPAGLGTVDPVVWFANWQAGYTPGANNITIRASIEYPAGSTPYPIYFRGGRDMVLVPGACASFDAACLSIPANTVYYIRTYVTVASSGMTWPLGQVFDNTNSGYITHGGYQSGTTQTDLTTSGTIADVYAYGYGPLAITGRTANGTPLPSVAMVGDSIFAGPTTYTGFQYQDTYMDRLLFASGDPFMNMALSGAQAATLQAQRSIIGLICSFSTSVISDVGINDIRYPTGTLSQIEGYLTSYWTEFTSRGVKVYQTTITPNSTSTDLWATPGNQTGVQTTLRAGINTWLRGTPGPLSGTIEVGAYLETSTNSNIWISNGTANKYTQDGLHPNPAASLILTNSVTLPTLP